MKQLFSIVAIVATIGTQPGFAQDSTSQSKVYQILPLYYSIKDALVFGNANSTSVTAGEFVQLLTDTKSGIIPEALHFALLNDAGKISASKDLKKQRANFAGLSVTMAALAKVVTLSDKSAYQAYCPMQKAYWLTSSQTIKNPYYGSAMLSCGHITETIQ